MQGHTQLFGKALEHHKNEVLDRAHAYGLKADEGSMSRMKRFGMIVSWAPEAEGSATGVGTPTTASWASEP
jgi:hypothetical protein